MSHLIFSDFFTDAKEKGGKFLLQNLLGKLLLQTSFAKVTGRCKYTFTKQSKQGIN